MILFKAAAPEVNLVHGSDAVNSILFKPLWILFKVTRATGRSCSTSDLILFKASELRPRASRSAKAAHGAPTWLPTAPRPACSTL